MATDEVRIILRGSSKELEASINRIAAGLRRLDSQSATTNAGIQRTQRATAATANRTSKSINTQNKSFTLMVAKLALVTFAVQTLANIVNSTFGAVLKKIDEFQIAAVGTAVAVTSISKSTKPIGEIFTNNLAAAKQAFEALDIVAADFFATGAELQLAFNTLAQRGVIVREDEFRILGKLTDQIKLLTGGQNTQIQIQQELRAILDGNVRTTTAFGKSLQARGVDVKQLSKELRATGSIKVFEQFLTGLDAASGAIRRTLSSVSATFATLFNQLTRNIFGETFDNVVSTVTRLNNLMIDNRDLIIQIGVFIKNEIAGAWDSVLDILDLMSATMIRLIQNDLVQFVSAFALAGKLIKRGPLGAILGVSTALTGVTGEAGTFGDITKISFDLLAIGIDKLVKGLDGIINVFKELGELLTAFGAGGFSLTLQVKSLQRAETALNDLGKDLDETNRQIQFLGKIPERNLGQQERLGDALSRQLRLLREIQVAQGEVTNARTKIEDTGTTGQQFLEGRSSNLTTDTRAAIADTLHTVAGLTDEASASLLKNTKEEAAKALGEFAKLAANIKIPPRNKGTFEPVIQPFDFNNKKILEQFAGQDVKQDITRKNELAAARGRIGVEESINQKLLDSQLITGREFFVKQQELRRADLALQEADANERIRIVRERTQRELNIIQAASRQRAVEAQPAAVRVNAEAIEQLEKQKTLTADQIKLLGDLRAADLSITGLTKITDEEQTQRTKLLVSEQNNSANILREILGLKVKGTKEDEKDLGVLKEQNRLNQQTLQDRGFGIAASDGETNSERAARITAQGNLAKAQFASKNTSKADQTEFGVQQDQIDVAAAVKTQTDAVKAGIDAAFDTIIDGFVEGSFEFRDLATTLSKDFIKAGFEGIINQVKDTVLKGLTDVFTALSDGAENAAAGAQRAAQGILLAFGLLLAVLSRTGNKGDFEATGGAGGSGIDSSSLPTRGLIGGDTALPIAEINNGLLEALVPTNNILAQIERNTRALNALEVSIGDQIGNALQNGLSGFFEDQVLQNAQP